MAASSFTPQLIAYYEAHADETLQPNEIAAGVCGLIIAYVAVAARSFARIASGAKFGWDDWLIVVSLVPLTGYASLIWYSVSVGDGRHMIYITNEAGFVIAFIAQLITYSVAIALIKISILFFYRRIFPSKTLFWISCVIGAIVIAYNVAIILVTTLQCIPLQSLWTTWGAQGHCVDTTTPYAVISIVNVITDFLILALPIKYVWKLQMRASRKLQVLFMFLTGAIVCVFGVIRVYAVATIPPVDQSYNDVYPEIWSFIEISTGVVAACLPTLGMLIKKARTISQPSKPQIPLRSNLWARIRGSRILGHSGKDMSTSTWSRGYGPRSTVSEDANHDIEMEWLHPVDRIKNEAGATTGEEQPDKFHVKDEVRRSLSYES